MFYSTTALRELITSVFSDEAFETFCYDHFRPVYKEFSRGMSLPEKIQRLIDHCERRLEIEPLLKLLEIENPAQYARFAPDILTAAPAPPPGSSAASGDPVEGLTRAVFCPACATAFSPDQAACPACGQAGQAQGWQPVWRTTLEGHPVAGPLAVGPAHLLLALHDSSQTPRQASLHFLRLSDGRPVTQSLNLEPELLVSGIAAGAQSGLGLVAAYCAEHFVDRATLFAYAADGAERWRWVAPVQFLSAPTVAGGRVWVTTNRAELVGLSLADGREVRRLALPFTPSPVAPLVSDELAWVPERGSRLALLRLAEPTAPAQVINGGGWATGLALASDRWLAGFNDGSLAAFSLADGRPLWRIKFPGQISPPLVAGARVVVGAKDGLHAFALATGEPAWRVPTERRQTAAPVALEGVVYAAGHDHHLLAVELETGRELWRGEVVPRRIERSPLLSLDPPLAVLADAGGNVAAWPVSLPATAHEAAGRFLAAAEAYAAQGELARAAELFQAHHRPYQAAQLWQALGQLEPAAEQYELAERWSQAAHLWQRLDRPLRQAEALVHYARSLAGADDSLEAEAWTEAAHLFQAEGELARAQECQREVARCRKLPLLEIAVQAKQGLLVGEWSHLEFAIHNQGFGPARKLIIQLLNKAQFEGEVTKTQQILSLQPDQRRVQTLDVKPLDPGQVPLRLNITFEDEQGQPFEERQTLYLPVSRVEAERRASQVYYINTDGGAVITGTVHTGGGDFIGRDQGAGAI